MKAYTKNTLRDITKSKSRFFSIFVIVALGVAFFAGLRATSPNMKLTADQYLDNQNVFDIMVMSTSGMTEDDVEKLAEIDGVKNVYTSFTFDAFASTGDNRKAVKVHSLEDVNKPRLIEGELPKKEDEIVAEESYLRRNSLEIGDSIELETETGTETFIITGIVESPLYMNRTQRGTNSLGTGTTEAFFFVTPSAAKGLVLPDIPNIPTVYTEIYVTVEDAKAANTFEDEYRDIVDPVMTRIEELNDDWIVLDRTSNAGIVTFGEEAEKIGAIGTTFPLIFFVVATMVCLTSMTRMVEEQRTQIGTFKALGYSKGAIVSHYLIYALLASVGGSIVGILIGMPLFPTVIFNAYSAMYDVPDLVTKYHMDLIISSSAAAILCTALAAVLACLKELIAVPAVLMRPKPPKMGKRIVLERVPFVWNRLSFIWKVTMRNLFRYKSRFIMTIVGIAACTGLLVTGFGLRSSISAITSLQYENIFTYDMEGTFTNSLLLEDVEMKREQLESNEQVERVLITYSKNSTATNGSGEGTSHDAYVFVPENYSEIADFIHLNDNGEELKIPEQGAIITKKLAQLLEVEEGDTILVDVDGDEVEIEVIAVTEQYVNHYIYMSMEYFETLFGEEVTFNGFLALLQDMDDTTRDELAEELITTDEISRLTFVADTKEDIASSIDSIDAAVVVLIVSAAALAFVVMYNLISININERKRELATTKVLGFYDKEVAAYVYRESILLSIIGTLVGLVFGVALTRYVLATAETDNLLFPRIISIPDFIYAGVMTLLFAGLVNLVMYQTLKKIDMIESLKSTE